MTINGKLTFLSLLWLPVYFTFCNGQVKTSGRAETIAIAAGKPVVLKTGEAGLGGNVYCSLQDRKGNIWFGSTGRGVYRYDGKSFTNFTTNDGLVSNGILTIAEDNKGNLWFGTDNGVSRYDGKIFTDIPLPTIKNFVTGILEDKKGTLWIATNHGVYCYNRKVFTRFLDDQSVINKNGLALRVVQQMLEDKQGNIWFTTKDEGVCRYDGKAIINYTPNDILWFRGLLEDNNGNIWAGSRMMGVSRFDARRPDGQEKAFTNILQNGRFDSCSVYFILQDKAGNSWFGTDAGDPSKQETGGGVWVYNGATFKNFTTKDGLIQNAVWCITEDKAGNYWFGTRNGICRYDGKTFTAFSE